MTLRKKIALYQPSLWRAVAAGQPPIHGRPLPCASWGAGPPHSGARAQAPDSAGERAAMETNPNPDF